MNILRTISAIVITLTIAINCCLSAIIYVSPDGNDRWTGEKPDPIDGSNVGPKATLLGALQLARRIRSTEKDLSSPIEIKLRGGIYRLAETLNLTPDDSGTEVSPLVFEAAPHENVTISGAQRLQSGRVDGGLWRYHVNTTKSHAFSQLYVNGARRQRVRMPKHGYYYIENSKDLSIPYTPDEFQFYPGDINPHSNSKDLTIRAFHDWYVYTLQVENIDAIKRSVTFNTPMPGRTRLPLDRKVWYVIENDSSRGFVPGEWHLAAGIDEMEYSPMPGEVLGNSTVETPCVEKLLALQGSSVPIRGSRVFGKEIQHIQFRNLTFAFTDWKLPAKGLRAIQGACGLPGAVEVAGAKNILFSGCTFKQTGAYALVLGADTHKVRVQNCTFTELGAGGIRIGSFDDRDLMYPAMWSGDILIIDNLISGYGQVHPDACGIMVGDAGQVSISNNEVAYGYYTAISVGWSFKYGVYAAKNNLVSQNRITHIGQHVMSDLAGIYTLGEQPNTNIVGNVIDDIERSRYGGWGIYLDEASASISVRNNLVYNVESAAVHLHWGRNIEIVKNVLALGKDCLFENTNGGKTGIYTFRSNILITQNAPYFGRFGILQGTKLGTNDYVSLDPTASDTAFPGKSNLASWSLREPDAESVNPDFTEPSAGDFTAHREDPIKKRGIDMNLFSTAGINGGKHEQYVNKRWWDPAPSPQ